MKRAISKEQKAVRYQKILTVAWEQFQNTRYADINVIDIAHGADLAKGTIYLYFKTKEELFLAVQEKQLKVWFEEINTQLDAQRGALSIEQLVDLIVATLEIQPALGRLLAILHTVLEHNITPEAAQRFKRTLKAHLLHTGARLDKELDFLVPGQGAQMLLQIYAIVIGVQHLTNPAPVVRQILEQDPTLDLFNVDFKSTFTHTLVAQLYGLKTLSGAIR